jgi:cathepsin D
MKRVGSSLVKRDIAQTGLSGENSTPLFLFLGKLEIGAPAQSFDVLFDTGSYITWVRSVKCTDSVCDGQSKFDGSVSTTYIDTNVAADQIRYGDGSTVDGTFSTDTVAIGSLSAPGFRFIEASGTSDDNSDGLVGLSKNSEYLYFDALFKTTQLDRYAIFIKHGLAMRLAIGCISTTSVPPL